MPQRGCPGWEYNKHASYPTALRAVLNDLLIELDASRLEAAVYGPDTRRIHDRLFKALTPRGYEYYAGHYRGSVSCLRGYEVHPHGDPTTKYAPSADVEDLTEQLAVRIRQGLSELDRLWSQHDWVVSPQAKLVSIVAVAAEIFSVFLLIHPYADGNGHAARFIVWTLLQRYGFRPVRWTIDPRPTGLPYIDALRMFRAGNRAPLQQAIIASITP
jgi:fido (protein-threonine AMPylation protein)